MRRVVNLLLTGSLVALVLASTFAAEAAGSVPRARLRGFVCQQALDPAQRALALQAVMRPLPGTKRMALRFDLMIKADSASAFGEVRGGDLGKWISPANASLGQLSGDVWIFNKQVVDLAAPDSYRLRVSFRWTGRHGRLLGEAMRLSPTCYQPELRPDLLVQRIEISPKPDAYGMYSYTATIENAGATSSGPFDVQFTAGSLTETRHVSQLKPHATSSLPPFTGPLCNPDQPPRVTVDPGDQVDDFNLTNNSLTATCPASGSHARPARSAAR